MIIILILVIAFIGIVLHLSFAYEEPEVKIFGLTFFITLILVGPIFNGIISIPAPTPLSSDNTIEVVSIVVALIMSAMALGIYNVIEEIRYRLREIKRTEKLAHKKGRELDKYTRIAEGDNDPEKNQLNTSDENGNLAHKRYLRTDILEIRITEIEHYRYSGYEYLAADCKIKNVGALPISHVSILMDIPFPEKEGYVEANYFNNQFIQPGQTQKIFRITVHIASKSQIKDETTMCMYDYRLLEPDEYGATVYCVDKNKKTACEGRIPVKIEERKTRWNSYNTY